MLTVEIGYEGCCIPHEELCVYAGYDQFQANYHALTSWPIGNPSLDPLRSVQFSSVQFFPLHNVWLLNPLLSVSVFFCAVGDRVPCIGLFPNSLFLVSGPYKTYGY